MSNSLTLYARHMGWDIPDKYKIEHYLTGVGKSIERISEYVEDRKIRISLYDSFCLLYCELYTLRRLEALEILYDKFALKREIQERKEIAEVLYATDKYEDSVKTKYVYDRVARILRDRELIANSSSEELLAKVAW